MLLIHKRPIAPLLMAWRSAPAPRTHSENGSSEPVLKTNTADNTPDRYKTARAWAIDPGSPLASREQQGKACKSQWQASTENADEVGISVESS